MPGNFQQNSPKTGQFAFDNNIIVRVFSRLYLVSSGPIVYETRPLVSVISTDDKKLTSTLIVFFSKLNFHRIIADRPDRIYAYDDTMTLVVGSVVDLQLPH